MQTNEQIARVVDAFAKYKNMAVADVYGAANLHSVCVVRYMIYAYLHNELKIPASKIGSIFGRTRVNVLRGIRVLKGWMRYHEDMKNEYLSIIQKIEGAE